ncbi:MAG: restriction endonuclease subunit S [Acinetobacter sp.]|uniref:restriction endonuclease subunit S n=1 Tax=Acinetobacter sp. TaxID=472 RepID=UPI000F9E2521|nr:restriction endonuclease subunit S [Acinetobacter sp.]RUP39153.1 MAG: restriction endonuclease subunit S [Acinetobacter sp.]
MVPKGWIKAPVQDFGHVSAGRQRSPNFTKGTLRPYLRVANVFENYIDTTDVNEMMFTESEYQRYKLDIGDILLNEGQSTELVGRPAMYVGYPENCCFQNTLVRFKADHDKVDASYALQRFLLCLYDGTFQAISKKTTSIAHLGVSRFAELNLLWPPLVEQQKITQILSTWDKAISTTEKLLENSQQQKKALMQQLLTGKKRLLDETGLKFNIPWGKYRLGALLKEEKQRNKDNSLSRVLSVTNHSGFVLPENQFSKRIASDEVSNYKVVIKDQFGYNPSRINVGSFARLDQFENGLLSPMYVVFSIKSENLDSDFFLYWMKSNEAKQRINNSTQGSVRDSVGFDAISSFVLKLPEIQEQRKIAKVLSFADQEIETLQKKLDCLKQEKKALMQQLLTGKKRVKVAV